MTSTSTFERTDPSMTLGTDGRLYVFWTQHQANTFNYGIYGQCFAKGVRQWGDNAATVEPLGGTYSRGWGRVLRNGDGVAVSYNDAPSAVQDNLKCAQLTAAGAVANRFDIALNPGSKYRYVAADAVDGGSVLVWHGSLWHGGGANRSDAVRVGIAMNYCAGWVRQQENQQLGIPREKAAVTASRQVFVWSSM